MKAALTEVHYKRHKIGIGCNWHWPRLLWTVSFNNVQSSHTVKNERLSNVNPWKSKVVASFCHKLNRKWTEILSTEAFDLISLTSFEIRVERTKKISCSSSVIQCSKIFFFRVLFGSVFCWKEQSSTVLEHFFCVLSSLVEILKFCT